MKTSINGEFFRGHIDTIILKLLYSGDRYGYDLIKEIEQKSDGKYRIKQATLYSSLRRLEEQGFLSSYWGEKTAGSRKKFYTLTEMGKQVFLRNQNKWEKSKDIIDHLVYGKNSGNNHYDNNDRTIDDNSSTIDGTDIIDGADAVDIGAIDADMDYSAEFDAFRNGNNTNGNNSNADDGQISEYFFLDENNEQIKEQYKDSHNDLKGDFESIFEKINSERIDCDKSYIDNMVNQTYKPAEKQADRRPAFDFFDEDEQPFNELPANEIDSNEPYISEPDFINEEESSQNDYNFLEPEPVADMPRNPSAARPSGQFDRQAAQPAQSGAALELSAEEIAARAKAKQLLVDAKQQNHAQAISIASPFPIQAPSKSEVEFLKYNSDGSARIISDSEIINRDYQQALSKLVKNIKRQPQPDVVNARVQQEKKLENVRQETINMGDSVIVRRHDDTVKQYNSENYFYKNKLMLVHYGIMFIFMLMQTVVAFAVFELILKSGPISTTDLWMYIGSVLLALLLPVYAFFCSYKDYSKRKLREKSFKGPIFFRAIVVLQFWVIISAINAFGGLLTASIKDYYATFIFPIIFTLNALWSYLLYILLLKSGKFNV